MTGEVQRLALCVECQKPFDLKNGNLFRGEKFVIEKRAPGDKQICFSCWLRSGKKTGYEV